MVNTHFFFLTYNTRCRCNSADISSKHLIAQCPLLYSIRGRVLRHTQIIPTKEMILDEETGPRLRMIAQIAGLGYGPELRWSIL
jgi:hypothetical protein